jgi:hypothetical protein
MFRISVFALNILKEKRKYDLECLSRISVLICPVHSAKTKENMTSYSFTFVNLIVKNRKSRVSTVRVIERSEERFMSAGVSVIPTTVTAHFVYVTQARSVACDKVDRREKS